MNRILIAEDESRIASFIEKGLRKNGFTTAIAADGDQAVSMALAESFDLLLLDLGLPGQDGWAVLKALRSQGKKLPIIIVSACDEASNKVAGVQGGANDFVSKPFQFKDLLARIYTQLDKN
ncbi:MAG TPA: response regulator [Cyanobacteria bacterium UBA11162]|nr:response regulator [Cyanobacteria bacterium UBA11162]